MNCYFIGKRTYHFPGNAQTAATSAGSTCALSEDSGTGSACVVRQAHHLRLLTDILAPARMNLKPATRPKVLTKYTVNNVTTKKYIEKCLPRTKLALVRGYNKEVY